jgi:hypothetical protein
MTIKYEHTCLAHHHEIFTGMFAKRKADKWLQEHSKCQPPAPKQERTRGTRITLCHFGPPKKSGSDKSI